jgi:hypothetical protein
MNFTELIKKSLSDTDIKKFFNNKINVIRYNELNNVDSIDEVLQPYGRCIILIESEKTNHWVLLQYINKPNNEPYILFFDSYGISVGNEFNEIPKSIQRMTQQDRNVILKLLIDSPLKIHYNQYRLQKLKNGVNTCGRWCCVKGLLSDMTEDEFAKSIRKIQKETKLKPDQIICLLMEK